MSHSWKDDWETSMVCIALAITWAPLNIHGKGFLLRVATFYSNFSVIFSCLQSPVKSRESLGDTLKTYIPPNLENLDISRKIDVTGNHCVKQNKLELGWQAPHVFFFFCLFFTQKLNLKLRCVRVSQKTRKGSWEGGRDTVSIGKKTGHEMHVVQTQKLVLPGRRKGTS